MTHLTAAYMAIGLITAPNAMQVQEKFCDGQLELVDNLVHYADYAWVLVDAAFRYCGNSPGVPDYELSEPFGAWFGEQILLHPDGRAPDHVACCTKLRTMTLSFYLRTVNSPGNCWLMDFVAALGAVALPKNFGGAA